jgi:hypothetical protein
MKLDLRGFIAPVLALALLGITVQHTMQALHTAGTWRTRTVETPPPTDPYALFDAVLSAPQIDVPDDLRNPLDYQARVVPRPRPTPPRRRPPVEQPDPVPVLTAIIWDADPRATVRYRDRDFSIRENGLFADYQVLRITQDQVVLQRNGERIVLTLPKGDTQ